MSYSADKKILLYVVRGWGLDSTLNASLDKWNVKDLKNIVHGYPKSYINPDDDFYKLLINVSPKQISDSFKKSYVENLLLNLGKFESHNEESNIQLFYYISHKTPFWGKTKLHLLEDILQVIKKQKINANRVYINILVSDKFLEHESLEQQIKYAKKYLEGRYGNINSIFLVDSKGIKSHQESYFKELKQNKTKQIKALTDSTQNVSERLLKEKILRYLNFDSLFPKITDSDLVYFCGDGYGELDRKLDTLLNSFKDFGGKMLRDFKNRNTKSSQKYISDENYFEKYKEKYQTKANIFTDQLGTKEFLRIFEFEEIPDHSKFLNIHNLEPKTLKSRAEILSLSSNLLEKSINNSFKLKSKLTICVDSALVRLAQKGDIKGIEQYWVNFENSFISMYRKFLKRFNIMLLLSDKGLIENIYQAGDYNLEYSSNHVPLVAFSNHIKKVKNASMTNFLMNFRELTQKNTVEGNNIFKYLNE